MKVRWLCNECGREVWDIPAEKPGHCGRPMLKMPAEHECAKAGCGVRLFDAREKYCQHHEANIAFGVESDDD